MLQLALTTTPLAVGTEARAQADIALQLPGYEGPLQTIGYREWFDIGSLDMSSVRVARFDGEGNRTLTGVETGPIEMVRSIPWPAGTKGIAAGPPPALAELSSSGALLPEATIHFLQNVKGETFPYYEIELTDVRVTSYQLEMSEGEPIVERFTLSFGTVNTRYRDSMVQEPWQGWDVQNEGPLP